MISPQCSAPGNNARTQAPLAVNSNGLNDTPAHAAHRFVIPALLYSGLWWVLAGGDPRSWVIGGPVVAAALWASHKLRRGTRPRLSLAGLLRFVPFFVWASLRGGADMALRILRPRMSIHPAFTRYPTRLATPSARFLYATCASLIPGTLMTDADGEEWEVHVISDEPGVHAELERLELAVAALFDGGGARG